ncbi:MAG: CotH kinase family protein [Candidatus Hinthialibacter antarcticus]|nr:CotH kinase family protein [Candidatus Hinthialibacter antarcticus]
MNYFMKSSFIFGIIFCSLLVPAFADVVINEIHYDPSDLDYEAGSLREFVELYNPGDAAVDLSGYQFTSGALYTFPNGTQLAANGYLVVVRVPSHTTWRNKRYQVLGPFENKLGNGGEWVELTRPDGTIVERLRYNDDPPWPRAADGYGPSLERIAWDLPADDYHSWRASLRNDGTPGAANTAIGTPPYPLIQSFNINPQHPTSSDEVTVQFAVDSPHLIESALLRWEETDVSQQAKDTLVASRSAWRYSKGTSAPSNNQVWTLSDFNDSAWATGTGGFGYGDIEQVETVLNDMRGNYTTVYLRRNFTVSDINEIGALTLSIFYDDGFIAYLNGQEVARASAPDNYTNESTSDGSHEANEAEEFTIGNASTYLTNGENTLAIVGFNLSLGNSSDFVLAPSLFASNQPNQNQAEMTFISQNFTSGVLQASIPPHPNQTLVRYNLELALTDGQTLRLPHTAETRPFESYFVYDNDIESKIPLMWIFPQESTSLPSDAKAISAAVIKPLDSEFPLVFDGVRYTDARNGNKLKFLKGEEFRGDRTLNISLETPREGTTAGGQSPHVEQISYDLFRDSGVLTPRCDWYRFIEDGAHTQRIAVQQPNERFLEINGRDPSSNIYKIAYNEPGGYSKKSNMDESSDDYIELFRNVRVNNRNLVEDLPKYLDIEEVMGYEVVTFLLSHWDGFKNNIFLYHDLAPDGKWEIIPWDTDKTFGYTDSDPMYWKMPIDFSLTLVAPGSQELTNRNLDAPIGRPFHSDPNLHEEFVNRVAQSLNGLFSLERMGGIITQTETLLLDDLALSESYTGSTRNSRRNQITTSYNTMRFFLENRHDFLRTQLPAGFTVKRTLPSSDYSGGSMIENIEITISPLSNEATNVIVSEFIPDGFELVDVHANHGDVAINNNSIIWSISGVTYEVSMTYSLQTPETFPSSTPVLHGIVSSGGVDFAITDDTLNYLPKDSQRLPAPWVTGAGEWLATDGVLTCWSEDGLDPKHAWVDLDLPTQNYTVRADVRMLNWQDVDHARSGVAVRVDPAEGARALNFLFHDDEGSVDFLNDLLAWGTRSEYTWQVGEWYTMTLAVDGIKLDGSIKKTGTNESPFAMTWEDGSINQRPSGFPGVTGSSLAGLSSQYDNFEVIVNGDIIFADDFNYSTSVNDWMMY